MDIREKGDGPGLINYSDRGLTSHRNMSRAPRWPQLRKKRRHLFVGKRLGLSRCPRIPVVIYALFGCRQPIYTRRRPSSWAFTTFQEERGQKEELKEEERKKRELPQETRKENSANTDDPSPSTKH